MEKGEPPVILFYLCWDYPPVSLPDFFAGVLVGSAGAEPPISFGAVDFSPAVFSPAVEMEGASFLAASLYESLR